MENDRKPFPAVFVEMQKRLQDHFMGFRGRKVSSRVCEQQGPWSRSFALAQRPAGLEPALSVKSRT
jgi:hypothetical protein